MICGRVGWRRVAVYKKKSVGRRREPQALKCPGRSRYHRGWIQAQKIHKKSLPKLFLCIWWMCVTEMHNSNFLSPKEIFNWQANVTFHISKGNILNGEKERKRKMMQIYDKKHFFK
jgi:hypothetical protein